MIEQQMIALLKEAVSRKQAQYIAHSVRAKMLKRQLVEAVVRKNLMNEDVYGGLVRTAEPAQKGSVTPPTGDSLAAVKARSQKAKRIAASIASLVDELPEPKDLGDAAEDILAKSKGVSSDSINKLGFFTDTNPQNNTYARVKQALANTEEALENTESARSELEDMYQKSMNDYTELQSRYEQAVQAAEQSREQGMTAQSLIDFISGPGYAQLSPEEQRRVRSAFREYVTGETRRRRERRAAARTARD